MFLAIKVARNSDGPVLTQRKYAVDPLQDPCVLGCKPRDFPMEQKHGLYAAAQISSVGGTSTISDDDKT